MCYNDLNIYKESTFVKIVNPINSYSVMCYNDLNIYKESTFVKIVNPVNSNYCGTHLQTPIYGSY